MTTSIMAGQVIAVVSHPRSGTHLTIDFLRRSFAELAVRAWPWDPLSKILYDLDWQEGTWGHAATKRKHFIVKTHELPFRKELSLNIERISRNRKIIYLYPFRSFDRTLLSYYRYIRYLRSDLGEVGPDVLFDGLIDPYFGTKMSVIEALAAHASWGIENALLLDIENLLADPIMTRYRLAELFGLQSREPSSPLPPRRLRIGRMAGVFERLRGRQSTEVSVENSEGLIENFANSRDLLSEIHRNMKKKSVNALF